MYAHPFFLWQTWAQAYPRFTYFFSFFTYLPLLSRLDRKKPFIHEDVFDFFFSIKDITFSH